MHLPIFIQDLIQYKTNKKVNINTESRNVVKIMVAYSLPSLGGNEMQHYFMLNMIYIYK